MKEIPLFIHEELGSKTHQHPTSGASGICPTHYHGVVDFLDDGDKIITLQLWQKKKKTDMK